MAVAVGLDIGIQAVKVAVLEGTAKKARLREFIDFKLEPGQTTRSLGPGLGTLLERIFKDRKIPDQNVVAAAPAAKCLTRELQVPFTRDDQIRKTIKFQAESVFHSISIDEMIVEYYKLDESKPAPDAKGPAEERSRLLVIALRKDALREQLELLETAGIDPSAVDLDLAAIFNAWTLTPFAAGGKRTLIVDLGAGSMKLLAIEEGRLRGLRSLRAQAAGLKVGEKKRPPPVTLEDLRSGLTDEERDDAFFMEEERPLPVVILDEEQTEIFDLSQESEESRQDTLEKIFLEIDRSLAGTRLDGPIEQVLLTGGGAAVEGVEKAFADHFDAPCERLSLAGVLAGGSARAKGSLDLVGATAVGLALKGLGYDKTGIDFRQEEFAFAGKFEKAKRGVACSLVLLFVFFFLLAYDYQRVEMERLLRKQERVVRYQQNIYAQLFPEEERPPNDVLEALKKKQRDLKGVSIDVPEIVSALDVLRDVAEGFEESGKKIKLRELTIKQQPGQLKGEVDDPAIAYDLKDAVNAKTRLVTVETRQANPNPKTGKFDAEFVVLPKIEKKKPVGVPRPPGE